MIPPTRMIRPSNIFICSNYSTYVQPALVKILFDKKHSAERKNSLLGPSREFPLPGDVICAKHFDKKHFFSYKTMKSPDFNEEEDTECVTNTPLLAMLKSPKKEKRNLEMVLTTYTITQLINSVINDVQRSDEYCPIEELKPKNVDNFPKYKMKVAHSVTDCPNLLKLELKNIFPGMDFTHRNIILLNLLKAPLLSNADCESTQCSSNAGSEAAKHEAKIPEDVADVDFEFKKFQLSVSFVEAATTICDVLRKFGYWADFIDPRNGHPYFTKDESEEVNASTIASFLEVTSKYRHQGFTVKENKLYKVIRSVPWNDQEFVGTIFTEASSNSEIVKDIIKSVEKISKNFTIS